MSWFSSSRSSGTGDAELLRDALVVVLERAATARPSLKPRVDRLTSRLQRFPVPTGLLREVDGLGSFGPREAPAERGSSVLPDLAADAVKAVTSAMRVTSLPDRALERSLGDFASALPTRMGGADARRVKRDAEALRSAAAPVRQRDAEARAELASLVTQLRWELRGASGAGERVSEGLDDLMEVLSEMKELSLVDTVRQLSRDSEALRNKLAAAENRAGSLEEVVSQQAAEIVDLKAKASKDALTGVANRGAYDKWLPRTLEHARRMDGPLALVLLDVDHFKAVNDTWGHPVGDAVLQGVAEELAIGVRDGDGVFRIGGEEFAVVLVGAPSDLAAQITERLRIAVGARSFQGGEHEFSVTISAGMVMAEDDVDVTVLHKRADEALYAAKRSGRDRMVCWEPAAAEAAK